MNGGSNNNTEDRLKAELLASLSEDYLDLASVAREVGKAFGEPSGERLRLYTLAMVHRLLREGLIRTGLISRKGEFVEWSQSPRFATELMQEAWEEKGRPPDKGEIAWFDLTPGGRAYAKVLFS